MGRNKMTGREWQRKEENGQSAGVCGERVDGSNEKQKENGVGEGGRWLRR